MSTSTSKEALKKKAPKEAKSLPSKEELLSKLDEINNQLDNYFKLPQEKIEKPRNKGTLRRERARIITLLSNGQIK